MRPNISLNESAALFMHKEMDVPAGYTVMFSIRILTRYKAHFVVTDVASEKYCNILNVCMFRVILRSLLKDAVHPQLYKVKRIRVEVERKTCINTKCFQLFFTFFPDGRTPEQLPSGLWNCSVAQYPIFQHHLACNLKADCEDGRDESSRCPFSSAECEGLVDLCDRCYKFVDVERLSRQKRRIFLQTPSVWQHIYLHQQWSVSVLR
ncbi:hypothetical protein ACOMHN_032294 [Nucella lapillus]